MNIKNGYWISSILNEIIEQLLKQFTVKGTNWTIIELIHRLMKSVTDSLSEWPFSEQ